MKRARSALLAALLLLPLLAACSGGTTPEPAGRTAAAATDTNAPETEAKLTDGVPEGVDFKGATFSAYTRLKYFFHGEMFVAEQTGETLNDARYAARVSVEDRLNVKTKEEYYGTVDYSDNDAPRTLLLAGDTTYALFNGRHVNMFNYAAEGMSEKLTALPYVTLSAPWWDSEFTSDVTLGGETYFAFGAYNLTAMDSIHMLLFNKKLIEDTGVNKLVLNKRFGTDLYGVVRDGKWTYDLMYETMNGVSADLNGDGKMTVDDLWAYTAPAKQVTPSMLLGGGFYMVSKDKDNFLVNSMEGSEAFYNAYTKILQMFWTNNNWFPTIAATTDAQEAEAYSIFEQGRALFCDSTGGNVSSYRAMDMDFGIVPYPKWNEDQTSYHSRSEYPELFCVPVYSDKKEMTGAMLEAMSSAYYETVKDAYFEISLKSRTARDSDSAEMLELIYSVRVFDFGDTILCSQIRDGKLRQYFAANNPDLTSMLAEISGTVKTQMDKLNEGFGKK